MDKLLKPTFFLMTITIFPLLPFAGEYVSFAEGYRYTAANKPDPFESIIKLQTPIQGSSQLQQYDISALDLVGTMIGNEVSALLSTSQKGEAFLARIGDGIGKKGGKIVSISRDKITIREPIGGPALVGTAQKYLTITKTLLPRKYGSAKTTTANRPTSNSDAWGTGGSTPKVPEFGALTLPSTAPAAYEEIKSAESGQTPEGAIPPHVPPPSGATTPGVPLGGGIVPPLTQAQ